MPEPLVDGKAVTRDGTEVLLNANINLLRMRILRFRSMPPESGCTGVNFLFWCGVISPPRRSSTLCTAPF